MQVPLSQGQHVPRDVQIPPHPTRYEPAGSQVTRCEPTMVWRSAGVTQRRVMHTSLKVEFRMTLKSHPGAGLTLSVLPSEVWVRFWTKGMDPSLDVRYLLGRSLCTESAVVTRSAADRWLLAQPSACTTGCPGGGSEGRAEAHEGTTALL